MILSEERNRRYNRTILSEEQNRRNKIEGKNASAFEPRHAKGKVILPVRRLRNAEAFLIYSMEEAQ